MADTGTPLQVLLVEDEQRDREAYMRDLPLVFKSAGVPAQIHPVSDFDEAKRLASDPSRRYDLILSDTYRGDQQRGDAAVIDLVNGYRGTRFCPLIVFSASSKPDALEISPFVAWADKASSGGIETAIRAMLKTGVPQAARALHDELDRLAGSYLWAFLERNWGKLESGGHVEPAALARLVRRRAAFQLAEVADVGGQPVAVDEVHGLEFYLYPPIDSTRLSLGSVLRRKNSTADIRVILTPHCYLVTQPGKPGPRADFVRLVKALPVASVLGDEKVKKLSSLVGDERNEKYRRLTGAPCQGVGVPEGRYWYLPAFLEIPHSFCDFLQIDSLSYGAVLSEFEQIAVLTPPYAESLQGCALSFDASVGIPNLASDSFKNLLG